MSGLGDSSVNFVCRPWAIPANYWDVYWDVTREVKRRFDAAGIGIPYPQRDVHLYIEKSGADGPLKAATGPRHPRAEPALSEGAHADGGFDTTGAGV
jgi:small-conductance mechanosensitive channel